SRQNRLVERSRKPLPGESRLNRLMRHSHVFIAHAMPGVCRIFGRQARPQGPIAGRLPNVKHNAVGIHAGSSNDRRNRDGTHAHYGIVVRFLPPEPV
ncbi:hypothetical protein, partial [Paenibacillus hemerocallicola]|uniref:hypothetical protein n=1 Tax=Paenibacillus hemerocallicola TaxID=1172614 RepID=UPI001C405938